MKGNTLYPVFLKLDQLQTLIVGGGNVGLEKLSGLLKSSPDAQITIVADFFLQEVTELATNASSVTKIERKFEWSDLDNKDFVILATDDSELHRSIKAETRKRNIITNVADTPDLCDAYLGSIIQKGDLKIGISTNGKSPTLAKRMRQFFEEVIPEDLQDLMDNLREYRTTLKDDFQEKVKHLNDLTSSMLDKK